MLLPVRLDASLLLLLLLCASAAACTIEGGWVTKEDVFSYQAANITVSGTNVTITPITPQSWTLGTGTLASPTQIVNVNFDGNGNMDAEMNGDCSQLSWSNGDTWEGGDDRCVSATSLSGVRACDSTGVGDCFVSRSVLTACTLCS
jgi:hypothetical protein